MQYQLQTANSKWTFRKVGNSSLESERHSPTFRNLGIRALRAYGLRS